MGTHILDMYIVHVSFWEYKKYIKIEFLIGTHFTYRATCYMQMLKSTYCFLIKV